MHFSIPYDTRTSTEKRNNALTLWTSAEMENGDFVVHFHNDI